MEINSNHSYDHVDPEDIILRLKKIIDLLKNKTLGESYEKELQTSPKN